MTLSLSSAATNLEFQELGNVEPERENQDQDDVGGRVAAPDPNPERPADREVPLQADGQRAEHRPHLWHVGHAVQEGQAEVVHVHLVGAHELNLGIWKRKKKRIKTAQMAERLIPSSEIRSSNPNIG